MKPSPFTKTLIKGTPIVVHFENNDLSVKFKLLKYFDDWVALTDENRYFVEAPLYSTTTSKIQKLFLGELDFKRARKNWKEGKNE